MDASVILQDYVFISMPFSIGNPPVSVTRQARRVTRRNRSFLLKFFCYSRLRKHICHSVPRRNPQWHRKSNEWGKNAPSFGSQSTDVDHRQWKLSHQHQQCPILLLLLQPHTHHWRFTQAYKIPRSIIGFKAVINWGLVICVCAQSPWLIVRHCPALICPRMAEFQASTPSRKGQSSGSAKGAFSWQDGCLAQWNFSRVKYGFCKL